VRKEPSERERPIKGVVSSKGEKLDSVLHVFGIENIRYDLEVADCLTDRQLKLMPVNKPGEFAPGPLPLTRDGEEIRILSEEDAAQLSCSLKKGWIFELGASVLVGGQNIHSAKA